MIVDIAVLKTNVFDWRFNSFPILYKYNLFRLVLFGLGKSGECLPRGQNFASAAFPPLRVSLPHVSPQKYIKGGNGTQFGAELDVPQVSSYSGEDDKRGKKTTFQTWQTVINDTVAPVSEEKCSASVWNLNTHTAKYFTRLGLFSVAEPGSVRMRWDVT